MKKNATFLPQLGIGLLRADKPSKRAVSSRRCRAVVQNVKRDKSSRPLVSLVSVFLLLIVGTWHQSTFAANLQKSLACEWIPKEQADKLKLEQRTVESLVNSEIFNQLKQHIDVNSKFAFPLQTRSFVQNTEGCYIEIPVYIDEGDHFTLWKTFLFSKDGSVQLKYRNQLPHDK